MASTLTAASRTVWRNDCEFAKALISKGLACRSSPMLSEIRFRLLAPRVLNSSTIANKLELLKKKLPQLPTTNPRSDSPLRKGSDKDRKHLRN